MPTEHSVLMDPLDVFTGNRASRGGAIHAFSGTSTIDSAVFSQNTGLRGGGNGDLYVYIFVKRHKLFERDGSDVLCEVPVSFVQAALGDTIEVPTIDGKVEMKIPAGIQSGTMLRLKSRGIPFLRGNGRGDQLVRIKVLTPQKLSARQKELLKEFGEISGENVNPEQKSFMDTIKKMFKK